MKDRLPDFYVLGIVRGGTSSMFRYLRKHPQILGPVKNGRAGGKEVNFYNEVFSRGIQWYRDCFPPRDASGHLFGEATPDYLCDPEVTMRLHNTTPDAKFICLLRDPVIRAWSHYCHYKQHELRGMTPVQFTDLARKTPERMKDRRSRKPYQAERVIQMGFYHVHFKRWFQHFDRDRFLIIKSENFFWLPKLLTTSVFTFLGLEDHEIPVGEFDNIDMLRKIRPKVQYPKIPPLVEKFFRDFYAPHNQKTYELLNRDFGW